VRTVYPVGTTLYQPDKCCNGYTVLWRGQKVKLIDMNGRAVNEWTVTSGAIEGGVDRARLLENGHVLVQRGGMMSEAGGIQEYNWDGELVWEYVPEGRAPHTEYLGPHHDVFRKRNGNTLLICRHAVPEEYLQQIRDPRYRNTTIYEDVILEVNREGEVVWDWHGCDHLDLNHYRILASPDWFAGPYNSTGCDWMHTNTVQALPQNKWHDAGDERFKPDNVIISPRSLDAVYIIDRDTKEVVWSYTGDYMGGLSGQHEPYMIEEGLPGAGNILIFDNGASPWKDLGHAGRSYVLEVDPTTKEIVWLYEDGEQFHSSYTSSAQRLVNGNTLICEAAGKRVFEVTCEGEIVWEYVEGSTRSYRYAYDHCPQTAALGKPREVPVTPPEELRIDPDEPLDD
jgi:predicted Rdx family selenoprotein